jgi:hypothetical protein
MRIRTWLAALFVAMLPLLSVAPAFAATTAPTTTTTPRDTEPPLPVSTANFTAKCQSAPTVILGFHLGTHQGYVTGHDTVLYYPSTGLYRLQVLVAATSRYYALPARANIAAAITDNGHMVADVVLSKGATSGTALASLPWYGRNAHQYFLDTGFSWPLKGGHCVATAKLR